MRTGVGRDHGREGWGGGGEGRQEAVGAAEGGTAGLNPLKSSGVSVF